MRYKAEISAAALFAATSAPSALAQEEGRRIGGFTAEFRTEVSANYDDNVFATTENAVSDTIYDISPSATLGLDRNSFELSLNASGGLLRYQELDDLNSHRWQVGADAAALVGRRMKVEGSLSYADRIARFGTFENDLSVEDVLRIETATVRTMVSYQLPWAYTVFEGFAFGDDYGQLETGGLVLPQDFRDRTVTGGSARIGRSVGQVAAYAEFRFEDFQYDSARTDLVNRDAELAITRVGLRYDRSELITFNAAIGYREFMPETESIEAVEGLSYDLSATWRPTRLTEVRVLARQVFETSVFETIPAVEIDEFDAQLSHDLTRFVRLFGGLSFRQDVYLGETDVKADTLSGRAGLALALRRNVELNASVGYDDRDAEDSFLNIQSYDRFRAGVGLGIRL